MELTRRRLLAATALLPVAPVLFAQAATERRFIFVIQRGAADGLDTVVPYAEPAYATLRGALAVDAASTLKLDGTFALHPSLKHLHGLYSSGQATFVHAVASAYRERSHFDGQNVLESGGRAPYQLKDGWMNRLLGQLPRRGKDAIVFSPAVPLALQGPIDVTTYAPSALRRADAELMQRVEQLYARDAQLHALWASALEARSMAEDGDGGERRPDPTALGRMAAGFLARADGPRLALIETGGWDTHSGQNARLARQLSGLDGLIEGLKTGLGAAWSQTVILVATEFGRTAAANGTGGTDHGTGAVALLVGGAVQGGQVRSDWPGLARANLLDGRDLQPTLALDSLIASVSAECFGLEREPLSKVLFPKSAGAKTTTRWLRS